MKQLGSTALARFSNSVKSLDHAGRIQRVTQLTRLSSTMEPLESRTLMSVGTLAVQTPPLLSAGKAVVKAPVKSAAKSAVVVKAAVAPAAPTAVNAAVQSQAQVKLTWADRDNTVGGFYVLRASGDGAFTQISSLTGASVKSFTDTAVTSGQTYRYEVQANRNTLASSASGIATAVTPPAAPSGLVASATSSSMTHVSWNSNSSATVYIVLRSTDGRHFSTLVTVSSNSIDDKTVSSLTTYFYEVQAASARSTSPVSGAASVTTPLAAPSGVTTIASGNSVRITWTDSDPAARGYNILRSTAGSEFGKIGSVTSAKTTTWTDNSAASNTTYAYEVQAVSGSTTSVASGVSMVTTLVSLKAPTALTLTLKSTGIQLSWTGNDSSATGYSINRSTDGVHFTALSTVSGAGTTACTDTTVSTGHAYSYQVIAVAGSITSAASNIAGVTVPLTQPTGLTTSVSGLQVTLTWTGLDSNATAYTILRSTNGSTFSSIAQASAAGTYTDSNVASGTKYYYQVQAVNGSITSAASNTAAAVTPLIAPTGLVANATTSSVSLSWVDADNGASGYNILRSSDGTTYVVITKLTGGTGHSYTDTTVATGHLYYYQVQAFNSVATSPVSAGMQAQVPMLAPSGLVATAGTGSISLAWTGSDSSATGCHVLRSSDGTSFTQLNNSTGNSYTDTTATAGQKYYYQVQAFNSSMTSAASNTTSATATAPSPSPSPNPSANSTVTFATRYSNELVITLTGTADTVSVNQSGSTLTIIANGQSYTEPVPAAGLFIYTRGGGTDGITVYSSVTVQTTIETIDGVNDTIHSGSNSVTAWDDANDIFTGIGSTILGSGVVHGVRSFAGGVSKAAGASLADPTDSGTIMHASASLWGTGPVADDVNQGQLGDCYFLSSLAAFAGLKPAQLQQSAVDMGDGTYTVMYTNGNPQYIRVSNDLPARGSSLLYAHPGGSGSIWAAIMEKAYAFFRTGANTYASIASGWMGDVYSALGTSNSFFYTNSLSESAMYAKLSADLNSGEAVTLGTFGSHTTLVSGHAYTLVSVSIDANGVTHYVVRNPWGISGDSLENSQGYATLTFAQLEANFQDACEATS